MKEKIKKILLFSAPLLVIVVILMTVNHFVSSSREDELVTAIVQARNGEDVTLEGIDFRYYGSFNGKDFFIAKPEMVGPTAEEIIELGGYTFTFPSPGFSDYFYCYVDGEIKTVGEAYADGSVTKEELGKLNAVME